MNVTLEPYDGPTATSYTLDGGQGLPVAVQTGARATLEVLQVHLGLRGADGATGGTHTHTQTPAAAVWTVNHNLGYRPAVSVLSVGGLQMWAEVLHASDNQSLVYFDSPTLGTAICS